MSKNQRVGERLPEDVGTDDCMASYTYTYSPDLLKYVFQSYILSITFPTDYIKCKYFEITFVIPL